MDAQRLITVLKVLAMSASIFFAVADSAFTLLPLFGSWLLVPASGSVGAGTWLALTADGVLLLLLLALLRSQLRAPSPSFRP